MTTSAVGDILARIVFDRSDVDMVSMYAAEKELCRLTDPRSAVPEIFLWFEENRDKWLGEPGPLVHFIERKLDFFPVLVESLRRQPTDHTVQMANRIANAATTAPELMQWINVLEAAETHPLADDACRSAAREMLALQRSRLGDA